MPFQSKDQQAFLFAKKPALAKKWAAITPNIKGLPENVKKNKKKKHKKPMRKVNYLPQGG